MPGFAVGDELLLLLFPHCKSNLLKTALYERELLLAANEEKERGKLVQTRAEDKLVCTMPSAAEVAQSENSCKREQKANLFALCRVQPRLHKVKACANERVKACLRTKRVQPSLHKVKARANERVKACLRTKRVPPSLYIVNV